MSSSLYKLEVKNREIPFIFEESNTLPIVSLKIIFRNSGANFDNKSGLANLSASLLQEGTLELGSEEFSLLLEESAINFSVGVGRETLVLNLDSITESFDRGVELLIKLLNSPNFSEEAFNRVQKRIYGQILQKKSNFDFVAKSELDREVWKGTPLEFPKVGTEESLEKIKLEDVKNFVSKHLVISKAIPVIGGDLNISQAEEILKKILSKLPEGETGNLEKYSLFEKRESKTMFKDTKQAYIYFSAPLNLDLSSEDIYKSKVAFFILGSSGFGSRLMEEVRVKRGLAYSVYAYGRLRRVTLFLEDTFRQKMKISKKQKLL
jgi:predicted Zn-dependent peptidase